MTKPNAKAQVDPALIKEGFTIKEVSMGDGNTGKTIWNCHNAEDLTKTQQEIQAQISKELLSSKVVKRDISFYSKEMIKSLKVSQDIYLFGQIAEKFEFHFGFVIPGSTNNWQQVIMASDEMMDPSILSGNLIVNTKFYDGENLICQFSVKIFYI